MNKGITSQVFVFISALILMALILVFGIKSIKDLTNTSENAELGLFIKNLRDEIEVFYNNDIGSSKEIKLVVPKKIEEVCFYTNKYKINKKHNDNLFNQILDGNKNNVFIMPYGKFSMNQFKVDYLRNDPYENPLCIKTNSVLNGFIEVKSEKEEVFVEIRRNI